MRARVHQLGLVAAALLAAAVARADGPARADTPVRDCALGFLAWCVAESERREPAAPTRLRLEVFTGYKVSSTGYYLLEERACEAAGCRLRFDGLLAHFDAFVRLWGNPLSDDYFDVGLSYLVLPVVTAMEGNRQGFAGELGRVAAGEGELSYAALRLSLRRPSLLYLVKSKYLINSFGVGVAFPVGRGAGRTFTGADGPKFTLGGRLGVQWPFTERFSAGIAASYGVVWYGPTFGHAAYVGGYGLSLQWLL